MNSTEELVRFVVFSDAGCRSQASGGDARHVCVSYGIWHTGCMDDCITVGLDDCIKGSSRVQMDRTMKPVLKKKIFH